MKKREWLDKINDSDLSKLLNKDLPVKEVPHFLDKKLINMIKNKDEIIKDRGKYLKQFFIRYIFSSIVICILTVFLAIGLFLPILHQNRCVVINIKGKAFKYSSDKNKIKKVEKNFRIKQKNGLITMQDSIINLKIGGNTFSEIRENSDLKFNYLYNNKKMEKTDIYMKKGSAYFDVNMIGKESVFEVQSNTLIVTVKGTKFNFIVSKENITKVEVLEGRVYIKPKIRIESNNIKKYSRDLENKINEDLNSTITLNKNESIEVNLKDLKNSEIEINKNLKSIENDLKRNKNSKSRLLETVKKHELKINDLPGIRNKALKFGKFEPAFTNKKITFKVNKIINEGNMKLSEKGTYITSLKNILFVTSDENSAIYSVNSDNGKIIWKFSDPGLTDITSPAFPFNNQVVIGTPGNIIILSNSGKVIKTEKIKDGPKYWALPVNINNKLYIPTSLELYSYDSVSLEKLNLFSAILGQIYITGDINNLYYTDSNEGKIKAISLKDNKLIWESQKIRGRFFSAPVFHNGNIYASDMNNSIYKFILTSPLPLETINIGSGVLTNLVYKNNKLYFIALNGWFYEMDANNLSNYRKIVPVDDKPDNNKYLTKKIFDNGNELYFSSDTGKLFYFNTDKNYYEFITLGTKVDSPLIGTPQKFNNEIFVVDANFNIYKVEESID